PDNPGNYYGGPAVFGLLEVVAPGTLNRNQDAAASEVAETAPTLIAVPDKLLLAPIELSKRSNAR
ncbi:MAG: hypothetical protein F6K55_39980, partial [Moorea sp. SIO4A3]|nr:hypothetical protein [Moorena sp. SIO4A3]